MVVDSPVPPNEPMRAQLLTGIGLATAVDRLARSARQNLLLLDLVDPSEREVGDPIALAQILGTFAGNELRGIASLRPSLVLEAGMDDAVLDPLLPYFAAIETGLVKSPRVVVDRLWRRLAGAGKRAVIDRIEHSLWLRPAELPSFSRVGDLTARPAVPRDLDVLVDAARASLREEGRPDPSLGDPVGFRRWVQGRLPRARVVEREGRVVFVGYVDVRRPDGWLVQGVYTWPDHRRRGVALAGMAAIVEEAGSRGADHVQLAVVDGNDAAVRLYRRLGFEAFDELRTVLFA